MLMLFVAGFMVPHWEWGLY